ncbi:MAG: phage antirepressor N-terminal domain-containing protein [Pseudomonadota bacterium]|nr:phage antirepressor N-terminal domain-containing protein [Pseudomonadota bacterium]
MSAARKFNPINDNPGGSDLVVLDFHGSKITTFEVDGKPYVAMRSVCEAIGIAWNGQFEKVKRDPVLSSVVRVTRTTGADGKSYEMSALPLEMMQGWLFKIDAARVRKSLRSRVIMFQRECYPALNAYWSDGVAVRKDGFHMDAIREMVKEMVVEFATQAMMEFTKQVMPQMIEHHLSRNPQVGAVTSVPALQVAIENGVKKRPRGFIQAVSNALTRFCESSPHFTIHRDVYGRKLFPREAINAWLAKGGWGPLKDRLDRQVEGQSVFNLVQGGKQK